MTSIQCSTYGVAHQEIFATVKAQSGISTAYEQVAEALRVERQLARELHLSTENPAQWWIEYEMEDEQFGSIIKGFIVGREVPVSKEELDQLLKVNNIDQAICTFIPITL